MDSLQIDLFLKKECCLGVRVRVRGSVFPLSYNFYVTNVNFTRVRYKLSSLICEVERSRFTFASDLSYIASIFFANENFTHEST